QFKSPLIYILVIAGIMVLIFKEYTDAIVIFGAVFINTIVGYIQENKASNSLNELKKVFKIKVKTLRDGNVKLIDSSELVPGDIIFLSPGDKVSADGRIIENYDLRNNEMSLTGEWLAAGKNIKVLSDKTPLADRDNMVYMGTIVEYGTAKVIVTATGLSTEIGKVAKMIKETKEEKTPLQKKIANLSKIIGLVIVIISIIIFIEGILTGHTFLEMFVMVVAVAIAAIPEGLPIALTVILALGMQRILKKRGLVRKLLAAETLGSTSIICTDKTRTLTQGKMMVSDILTEGELLTYKFPILNIKSKIQKINHSLALKIAVLSNEAFIENPEAVMSKWIVRGRPTDKALLLAGMESGFDKKDLEKKINIIAEFPFDSKSKYLAKAFSFKNKKEKVLYVAGAPEKLLEMSKYLRIGDKEKVLNSKLKREIKIKLESLAKKGLRVVSVGYRNIDNFSKKDLKNENLDGKISEEIKQDLFNNLVFVGLIGLKDPIRKEVKKAIKICRTAGMTPIIVTGDHKLTAKAVAIELGFEIKDKNIMEGEEMDKISDKELGDRIKDIKIYSRVEPGHKMRIISAWQEKGEVVAMTGDGINDAPAIKKADIGIALGSGTEVAKEISDMILLSDNFNVIVLAVEEGRAILDNIRKVIVYLLSSSFSEIILISASLLFGFPLPVTAVQILWVNLMEDGFPDIALAFEPKEKDLMKRKPEKSNTHLLNPEMKAIIFIIGIFTDLMLLGLFFWLWNQNHDIIYIRTIIFVALSIDSLFYVFSCKSLRKNIWEINIFSNRLLVFAWIFGIIMLIASVYLPIFQALLKTVPLGVYDWIIIMSLGLIGLILIEVTKFIYIKKSKKIS
ncbi:MAG: HAD-IC family P-type ATPase, partial [Candidatus Nealsonbacteria bacterium]